MCTARGGNVSCTSYVVYMSRLAQRAIVQRCRRSPQGYFTVRGTICPLSRRLLSVPHPRRGGRGIIAFLKHVAVRGKPRCFIRTTTLILGHAHGVHFVVTNSNSVLSTVVGLTTRHKVTSHFRFPKFRHKERMCRTCGGDSIFIVPSISRPFKVTPLRTVRYKAPSVVSGRSNYKRVLSGIVGASC